jgi:hypothetical protein
VNEQVYDFQRAAVGKMFVTDRFQIAHRAQ